MRKVVALSLMLAPAFYSIAQNNVKQYPVPEFINEISYLNRDSSTLVRLEKSISKQEYKSRFGGGESGYSIDGIRSPVRLKKGNNISFVYYTGESGSSGTNDSMMKAHGVSPNMMEMFTDPSQNTSLYNLTSDKTSRMLIMSSGGGPRIFGKGKKESTKFSFSVKKIKPGYYELVSDKPLPAGEYAFMLMTLGSMSGTSTLFAFGVD